MKKIIEVEMFFSGDEEGCREDFEEGLFFSSCFGKVEKFVLDNFKDQRGRIWNDGSYYTFYPQDIHQDPSETMLFICHLDNNKVAVAAVNVYYENEVCSVCGGYNYELLGCCNGIECGCGGMPVDSKPCEKCNPDGKKEPSLQAQEDWPFFFLTEKEYRRHIESQKDKIST